MEGWKLGAPSGEYQTGREGQETFFFFLAGSEDLRV